MAMLSDKDAKEVTRIFGALVRNVRIDVFTRTIDCPTCPDTEKILRELDTLSDRLRVRMHNPETDGEKAAEMDVDAVPTIIVSAEGHGRVRFVGTPSGYEFTSLLTCIVDAGGEEEPLGEEMRSFLDRLEEDLEMKVFVTPECPYCPASAVLATRMARYSEHVRASVYEAQEFPEISARYRVQGVPRTVVNDRLYAEGALPEPRLAKALSRAMEAGGETEVDLLGLAAD